MGERDHSEKDLNIPNILKMVDNLDKIHKGIRRDYDQLCNLVHPNPKSRYANFQTLDEKKGVFMITTRLPKMSDREATIQFKILFLWTKWIFDKIIELAEIFRNSFKE
jgi:hypothetical protein